jgi:AcrR family transcriptional regulator
MECSVKLKTGIMAADDISLREIARRVTVSASSVYRHFPDKQALLTAMATAGLDQLADLQRAAFGAGGIEGFTSIGRAHVRFALANPTLFRLAYSYMPDNLRPGGDSYEGSAAWLPNHAVAALLGPKASAEDQYCAAIRAWSLVHGLAMLMLDGQVLGDERLIERVISSSNLPL